MRKLLYILCLLAVPCFGVDVVNPGGINGSYFSSPLTTAGYSESIAGIDIFIQFADDELDVPWYGDSYSHPVFARANYPSTGYPKVYYNFFDPSPWQMTLNGSQYHCYSGSHMPPFTGWHLVSGTDLGTVYLSYVEDSFLPDFNTNGYPNIDLSGFSAFALPVSNDYRVLSYMPQVAEWTRQANAGDTIAMTVEDLDDTATDEFLFYAQGLDPKTISRNGFITVTGTETDSDMVYYYLKEYAGKPSYGIEDQYELYWEDGDTNYWLIDTYDGVWEIASDAVYPPSGTWTPRNPIGEIADATVVFSQGIFLEDEKQRALTIPPVDQTNDMYVVWPKNTYGYGNPIAINQTEAWWVGPDTVASNGAFSVYGRNLQLGSTNTYLFYSNNVSGATGWITNSP